MSDAAPSGKLVKPALIAALDKLCPYCNKPMAAERRGRAPTRDHVIPRVMRVKTKILIVCQGCNTDKGAAPLRLWLQGLEMDGNARAPHVRRIVNDLGMYAGPGLPKHAVQYDKTCRLNRNGDVIEGFQCMDCGKSFKSAVVAFSHAAAAHYFSVPVENPRFDGERKYVKRECLPCPNEACP